MNKIVKIITIFVIIALVGCGQNPVNVEFKDNGKCYNVLGQQIDCDTL